MTIRETVVTVLETAGLTGYPGSVPAKVGTYPCVVYQIISNKKIRTHAGNVGERPRVQLSCYGKTLATCVATAETVKAAMDLNQTNFELATLENEQDAKEVEPGIHRVILEFFIWD